MTSLYDQSIPVMIRFLQNMSGILKKANEHCADKGTKAEELLTFRLIEDMRPLTYQVQSCCNTAKFLAARVAGHENVYFPDDETTFEQLQARINDTIKLLEAVNPAGINGKEKETVLMETRMGTFKFTGQAYVSEYALPNFHFHMTTAYCILRHLGVSLGALDYLAGVFHKVEQNGQKA